MKSWLGDTGSIVQVLALVDAGSLEMDVSRMSWVVCGVVIAECDAAI